MKRVYSHMVSNSIASLKQPDLKEGLTVAVPLIILEPPEAPTAILTSPFLSVTIDGDMEDRGRLPGRI